MPDPGILYILSSPSGGGKTTLAHRLLEAFAPMGVSVSYTTRRPRAGEVDGRDYHFVDDATFDRLVAEGAFAEHARVHDHRYGTARRVIDEDIAGGHDLLFDVDYQGARALKGAYPHAVAVLLLPPSMTVLAERLRGRAKDSPDTIERRLRNARVEISAYQVFDYIVVNDDLERAFDELRAIVVAARCRRERRQGAAQRLLEEWETGPYSAPKGE